MTMLKTTVVDGLAGKNADTKVSYGLELITALEVSIYYSGLTTEIARIKTARSLLIVANGTKNSAAIKTKEEAFDIAVQIMASAVQVSVYGIEPVLAKEMVESAGLTVKRQGNINITILTAKKGKEEANSVILRRKSLGNKIRAAYVWEISIDGGITWILLKVSTIAKVTTVITPGIKTYFRVAIVIGEDQSDFSDPVSITL